VDQIPNVEELLKREPKRLPTVIMLNKKDDIFAYRSEDFELSDYDPHPAMKDIPVAV
jgi:thymidylate synthase